MERRLIRPMDPPHDWANLKFHPLSEICEFGAGIDVEALAGDMEANGYDPDQPVVLLMVDERKRFEVLDGRHRLQGAIKAEVVPSFALFIGSLKQQESYVGRKVLRQHLSESQRALIAANIVRISQDQSRKFAGTPPKTQSQAAASLNVSERSVNAAAKVLDKGTPELQKAVKDGTMKVSTAAQVADEDDETQREIVQENLNWCERCTRHKKQSKDCPVCAEMAAKADKPRRKKKSKNLTRAGKALDWNWFDRQVGEMNRFFLELKVKDAARRDFVMKQLMQFSGVARDWKKEEAK